MQRPTRETRVIMASAIVLSRREKREKKKESEKEKNDVSEDKDLRT